MRSSSTNLFVGRNKKNCIEIECRVRNRMAWLFSSNEKNNNAQTPQIAISSKVPLNNIFSAREPRYPYVRYVWELPSEKGSNKATYSFDIFFLFALESPDTQTTYRIPNMQSFNVIIVYGNNIERERNRNERNEKSINCFLFLFDPLMFYIAEWTKKNQPFYSNHFALAFVVGSNVNSVLKCRFD